MRETTLHGRIVVVHRSGPPDFGQDPTHDLRITYVALEANGPVDMPCDPGQERFRKDLCKTARVLMLSFKDDPADRKEGSARALRGRRVAVDCTLYRAVIANEYTPIVCVANRITPLDIHAGSNSP